MNKKKFKKILKKEGFVLKRKSGRHHVYSRGIEIFPLSSSGSYVTKGIIWEFQKRSDLKILKS